MKRRDFIRSAGVGSLMAAGVTTSATSLAKKAEYKWKMVTTWPKNFPGLGTGAEFLAQTINELSGGRLHVKVYGAKELVPPFEVFDAVSNGTAEMGHSAAYYWKGKSEASQFFAAVPFGLNAQEMDAWLTYGGGYELWSELYANFGLIPFAAGNSGVQMAGWFNKPINNLADLKGLKMRIPGLGGEVLKQAGGTPVNLPGGELFMALQNGTIDATEWVGPYNDLAFGLHKAAKYYYYPGWHEPGSTIECMVNQKAYNALPQELQKVVEAACAVANQSMQSDYTAKNRIALQTLVEKHNVDLRKLPDEVLKALKVISDEIVANVANKDAFTKKVFDSFNDFRKTSTAWQSISEGAYLNARQLST